MADSQNNTQENILISLKLDLPTSAKQIDELKNSVKGLKGVVDDFNDTSKESTEERKRATDESKRATDAGEKAKKAIEAEEGSIRALREENKKLTQERNNTTLATEEGRKKVAEINKHLDENNKKIKENVDSYTQQKINIGNYKSALDGLVPGLGGVIDGLDGMTKAGLKFIATPIGLILAAIALALAAVAQYFTRTEEGGDKLARVMAQLSAVFNVILDRVAALGGALVKLFTGDFTGAVGDAQMALTGVGDEMEREVRVAGELADILDKLEDRELNYEAAVSATSTAIKQLIIESKNRSLSEDERMDKLKQATDLEIKSNEVLKGINLDKLAAATKQIESDFSHLHIQKLINESETEYATRIIANEGITTAARKKVLDALKNYNEAQGQSLELQEKIQNRLDQIEEKRQAARATREAKEQAARDKKKAQDDKESDELLADMVKNMDREAQEDKAFKDRQLKAKQDYQTASEQLEARDLANMKIRNSQELAEYKAMLELKKEAAIASEVARMNTLLANESLTEVERQAIIAKSDLALSKIQDDFNKRELDGTKKLKDSQDKIHAESEKHKREVAEFTHLFTSGLFKKNSIAYKVAKTGETIIATYEGAQKAFSSAADIPYVGWILAPIAAGLAIAAGLKSVATINGVDLGFASGGKVPLSGTRINSSMGTPINRSNGDNLLATVATGEVILNRQQQAALGGDATFRGIGVPGFASGGVTGHIEPITDLNTRNAMQGNDVISRLDGINQSIQQQRPVMILQDFEYIQGTHNAIKTQATML